jgi:hypothetical protein
MTKTNLLDRYPVYFLEIKKEQTSYNNVDEIIAFFKEKVEAHPIAGFISIFDHYAHTSSIKDHSIDEDIKDAKNLVFCFGKQLPNTKVLAVRPRSIGVSETSTEFHIALMEAPNEKLTVTMQEWVKEIVNA